MSDKVGVAIIGAGAAGIAAARYLAARDRSVLLVESLRRLGAGRIRSSGPACPSTLAADGLHSGERNPLVALARACLALPSNAVRRPGRRSSTISMSRHPRGVRSIGCL